MKTRIAVMGGIVASALTLAGCGTVDNICLENEQTGQVPMHIYGGLEADIRFLAEDEPGPRAANSGVDPFKVVYLVADLPLSFVGDTVTLPLTVPWSYMDHLTHRSNPLPQATGGPPGGNAPPPSPQDTGMGDAGNAATTPGFSSIKP